MRLDTREFNKVLDEYMTFQKRTPADVVNAKLYYVARNATMTTKATEPSKIESELMGPSKSYPDAPLGAIIVNSILAKKDKKGLTGSAMASAIEKLIKQRKRTINFVRAGWKNAIQILEQYMRSKGELNFARRYQPAADKATMRKRNVEKLGKATPARVEASTTRAWGEIENNVSDKEGSPRLDSIKEEGLQKAIDKETQSMRTYIERKLNPVHKEFNRKQF